MILKPFPKPPKAAKEAAKKPPMKKGKPRK